MRLEWSRFELMPGRGLTCLREEEKAGQKGSSEEQTKTDDHGKELEMCPAVAYQSK